MQKGGEDMRLLGLSTIIAIAAMMFVIPAHALELRGEVKPRHVTWAKMAKVSLPRTRVYLRLNYDPMYVPSTKEIYLPRPGWGNWTYWDERVLFYHELGHAFDFRHLSNSERNQFRELVETRCGWWSSKCYLPGMSRQLDNNVPPGEMFAEQYSACALGMTLFERDSVPSVSYGWSPPEQTEMQLCEFISSSI